MNLHEYQSKILMARYGLPVLKGKLCYTPKEAQAAADALGTAVCVVKAQVHAGGRGKGGGVKVVKSIEEVKKVVDLALERYIQSERLNLLGTPLAKENPDFPWDNEEMEFEYEIGLVPNNGFFAPAGATLGL